MILDVLESSFNLLQFSFTMFSQIMFRTVLKITIYPDPVHSLDSESANVLYNSRFVISRFLRSLTFSERSFRSLWLSCFEFFHKPSYRGSKQSIIGLGRLESWRYLEFVMESGFRSVDGPLWGSLVFDFLFPRYEFLDSFSSFIFKISGTNFFILFSSFVFWLLVIFIITS